MIHDLTITLSEKTLPFLPADDPHMTRKHLASHESHPVQVSYISMSSHLGTHVDVPLHFIKNGKTTEQIDLAAYCGQAVCLDVPGVRADKVLDISDVLEQNKALIKPGDIIILHTGWDKLVGTREYFDYPDFDIGTGELLQRFGARGFGLDLPSLDHDGQVHRDILGREIGIIESLINLKPLIGKRFFFSAVPLKFEDGDGSPVRAYAIEQ
jgi:kynurenine formamidase